MDWFRSDVVTVLDAARADLDLAAEGALWRLIAGCARAENGGRYVGAAAWSDLKWAIAAMVTRTAVECVVGTELARWDGDDLVVLHADRDGESALKKKRAEGRRARAKQLNRPQRTPPGSPRGSPRNTPRRSPSGGPPADPKEKIRSIRSGSGARARDQGEANDNGHRSLRCERTAAPREARWPAPTTQEELRAPGTSRATRGPQTAGSVIAELRASGFKVPAAFARAAAESDEGDGDGR